MTKFYLRNELRVERGLEDLVISDLEKYLDLGLEIRDSEDVKDFLESKPDWEITDLKYNKEDFVDLIITIDQGQIEDFSEDLRKVVEKFGKDRVKILSQEELEDRDWNEVWKENFKVIEIGRNFKIVPSWIDYEKEKGDKIIEIDPGMAFGTGTHETTALLLEEMEDINLENKRVLDLGCGSGILGIGACLLGAGSVDLVDIDEDAVKIAKENVEKNGQANKAKVYKGNLLEGREGKYDLILANILSNIILDLIPSLGKGLKDGGIFISSGILNSQADQIVETLLAHNFYNIEKRKRGDWVSITAFYGG